MSIREEFSRGVKYTLGNGRKIRFWLDTWSGGCGLNLVFPNLYAICNQQEWTIDRVMRGGKINLTFRRGFGAVEENEWGELVDLAERVNITQQLDSVCWNLESSGKFTTASLYKELTFPGVSNTWMLNIWTATLPLKIKIFLWQICNDKLQTAEQLGKRNWTGPVECKLCGKIESAEHLFLQCIVASFCWNVVRDALGWPTRPVYMEEVWAKLIVGPKKTSNNFIFLFDCLSWSLWLIRNDFVFNNVLMSSPDVSVFRTLSFMQKWKILNKEQDQIWIAVVMRKLKAQLSSLRSEEP
jgi:hypothetical protein